MPFRGGPLPDFGQMGQVGQQAQSQVPGLLQMAQSAMGGGGSTLPMPASGSWMPASLKAQLPSIMQQYGGGDGDPGRGSGSTKGQLPAWYNEANWGPPPPLNEDTSQGWFPNQFNNRGPGSTGKFWTMKDYDQQRFNKYGGQLPEVGDERPNTLDWRLLGNSPGDFMFLGHHIGMGKLNEDLHQGWDSGGEGGSNRPPIRRIQGRGPENPASFIHGGAVFTGLPGQLENWAGGQPYWT